MSDIIDDDSSDSSDSDDDEEEKTLKNGQREFNADSSLPPVPNGTLDLTIPSDKQRFSSDDERWDFWQLHVTKFLILFLFRTPKTSDNKSSELRHRNRAARQEVMQDKIREIKRKQKETENRKISLPKKRRSLILSIVSGVLILSVVAYFYMKS